MTNITIKLSTLKAILPFTSAEESRYYLRGVYFDNDKIVATDRQVMAILKPENAIQDGEYVPFILPIETIKQIAALVKFKKRENCLVKIDIKSGKVYCRAGYGESFNDLPDNGISLPFKPIDETYPDYMRVIAKIGDNKSSSDCFNPSLLGRFSSLGDSATFYFGEHGSPACVRTKCDDYEAFGLVMPMRSNIKNEQSPFPEWLGLEVAQQKEAA